MVSRQAGDNSSKNKDFFHFYTSPLTGLTLSYPLLDDSGAPGVTVEKHVFWGGLTVKLFLGKGPFVGQITRELVFGLDKIPAEREDDMVDVIQVEESAQVETHAVVHVHQVGTVEKDLPAKGEVGRKIPLQFPA